MRKFQFVLTGCALLFLVIGFLGMSGVISIFTTNELFLVPILSLNGIVFALSFLHERKKLALILILALCVMLIVGCVALFIETHILVEILIQVFTGFLLIVTSILLIVIKKPAKD